MFVPLRKEVKGYTGAYISHRQYYLVAVEAIVGPVAVVPDLVGEPNTYLQVKSRSLWRNDFIRFLESEHNAENYYDDDPTDAVEQEAFV